MVIEKIKLSKIIADLSVYRVHYCYFDEGNLQVIYRLDLMKAGVRYILHQQWKKHFVKRRKVRYTLYSVAYVVQ